MASTAQTGGHAGHSSRKASARGEGEGRPAVTLEEREQMIAEGAYYRAERRGFKPGYDFIDWLEAERDIDAMLHEPYDGSDSPLV